LDTVFDDHVLWANLIKGNRLSLNAIYSKYFNSLYQYGMRMTQDEDAVKDCLQNLFLSIWVTHSTLRTVKNLRSYLISSLRNEILSYRTSEGRIQKVELGNHEIFDLQFTVEAEFIKKEDHSEKSQKLSEAMNKLTARQKEIVYLRYFEGLEYEEISQIMDISMKGTYKLIARALEALRQIMNLDKIVLIGILLSLKR
jgi:RNA polymerase sigma factor (sigma-70 family)